MSSIEERLARDIEAITGGVVVTESDLRDARDAVDQRIDRSRNQGRRRAVIAGAAAAVVISVLGVIAFQTIDGDEKTAPPANPGPTTSDPGPDTSTGMAPTPELVQGVWRLDNGNVAVRFSAPDSIYIDDSGQLFHDPGGVGTYQITEDMIIVRLDGGGADCAGQEFALQASIPEPGSLNLLGTDGAIVGNCLPDRAERWVLHQVLPTNNEGMAALVFSKDKGWAPVESGSSLHGVWMAEGGGYVLEMDPDGSYYLADDSSEPVDRGQWSLRGSDLTLTSSASSTQCSEGDRMTWDQLELIDPGTRALRGAVSSNDCGGAWTPKAWILIPHDGS